LSLTGGVGDFIEFRLVLFRQSFTLLHADQSDGWLLRLLLLLLLLL
jgi:hypothetical protein